MTAAEPTRAPAVPRARPLEGVRVLDAATILAGPVAATLLADFGAEVIKVEMPGRGDAAREGPGLGPGLSYLWLQEGRNKRSVTLDLHDPEGQELFRRLAAVSDIVIESFRPGTLEGWGLGPEALHERNPRLVILRVSGYGQTGPYRRRGAFDRTASAFGGSLYVTGHPDRPPVRSGYASADYMAAYAGAFAALMALHWRDHGGTGQVIDLALFEPVLRASEASIPLYHRAGHVRERGGDRNPYIVPSSSFATADGRWVVLSANTEVLWRRLAEAIGMPHLTADPRFATLEARCGNADELYRILGDWAKARTAGEIVRTCDAANVPAASVNSIADLFADPQIRAREDVIVVDDERVGPLAVAGIVPKMSATPGRIEHLGEELGTSTQAVLGGLLGLSDEDIARLRTRGVV